MVSYKSVGQLPREPEIKQLKIFVDKKYETVIVPVYGVPVPYHISTIKVSFVTNDLFIIRS